MIAPFTGTPSFRTFLAGYLVLLFIALIPLGLASIPPLIDYPNHLARMHVLIHGAESEALQRFYRVNWAPMPNLAMDLVVPGLAAVMPLGIAGRVFIGLTFVLISGGTAALHYTLHRRVSPWPLLAFVFLYNFIFFFGFLNYMFGVGIFLWAFAAWIFLRGRVYGLRIAVASVFALILFFSHLYALGLFGLAVLGYEAWRWRQDRAAYRRGDWLALVAPFVLPLLILLVLSPTPSPAALFAYGPILDAIKRKLAYTLLILRNYDLLVDGVTLWALACLLVFGFVARALKVTPAARWPLILFALALAAMPPWFFDSAFADVRLVVPLVFLFIAGATLHWSNESWKPWLAALLLGVFLVRTAVVAAHWQASNAVYGEYIEAFDEMAEGSRLLPVYAELPENTFDPLTRYAATLAVITRSAYVPTIFSHPAAHSISVVADVRTPWKVVSPPLFAWLVEESRIKVPHPIMNNQLDNIEYLRNHWQNFDYLLMMNAEGRENPMPSVLSSVFEGGSFHLYKIAKRGER